MKPRLPQPRLSLPSLLALSILVSGAALPLRSSDSPEDAASASSWQEVAAARARVLSEVKWTPVAETMPNRRGGHFEKGEEVLGVPYSSVKSTGRYIGFDISLRTFLAAVENPQSVLYTESLVGVESNAGAYYGSVCSAYTSYALGCGIWEVSRRHGPKTSEGVVFVEPQSAQGAEVGDVIYTPYTRESSGSHVEIVTAVTRDESGRVVSVRVDESRPPSTKITERSAENFDAHLAARDKELIRVTDREAWLGDNQAVKLLYPDFDADAAAAAGEVAINRSLLLDLGDWVPYRKGETVKFHAMDRDGLGAKALVLRRDGETLEEITLKGPGVVERTIEECGDYFVHLVHADGSESEPCVFAVCDLELRLPGERVALGEAWEVEFATENIEPVAIYLYNQGDSYGRHPLILSVEERASGRFTVPADLLRKPGTLQVWLIGEHPLGRLKLRKDVALEVAE